jgi:hypothetical protein
VFGTEGDGLSAHWMDGAQVRVRIPDAARDRLAQRGSQRRRRLLRLRPARLDFRGCYEVPDIPGTS